MAEGVKVGFVSSIEMIVGVVDGDGVGSMLSSVEISS